MLFKKNKSTAIDSDQLELAQYAQNRIRQKKRLYYHFVFFIVGCIALLFVNLALDYGREVKPFGLNWSILAIAVWGTLFLAHLFDVFVTSRFMGAAWEHRQMQKLMVKQQERIQKLKTSLLNEEKLMAESEIQRDKLKLTASEPTKKQTITIIAAADENNAIGKDNDLIWHLSDDLKHFKELTKGHHVIMGRKTFESMPSALPNRTNVVITRRTDYSPENTIVVNSLKEALKVSQSDKQPFIIGGGEIYKQAMEFANRIELTRVHHEFEADTYFPEINESIWKVVDEKFHPKDEKHLFEFTFIRYERRDA
ncbi:dihydrofolate reductase [Sungkyunkwania multivorans]|uniref:dihydrofolate reductase n=1 Tax=Sungkyunkwania multivorans TaxID=1173618 RepID=A0ABW3CZP2_9FLAO